MKKYFFILGGLLIVCFWCFGKTEPQASDYENVANAITEQTAKKLSKEKNLELVMIGGGSSGDTQVLGVSFFLYHETRLPEARQLLVYVVENFLAAINENQKIQPFLREKPFAAKNVKIEIYFSNPDRSEVTVGKISCVSSVDGVVAYSRRDTDEGQLIEFYQETYDEACARLKNPESNN